MVTASQVIVGPRSTLFQVVSAGATHFCVKVVSRRHGRGTVRNTTVAVPVVPNACKPIQ